MEEVAKNADCVVIVTDHSSVDYSRLLECWQLIADTRNRLKGLNSPKIKRL
jgi:UDP-N-acetyl-D-glucosamine dehydrogenase